LAAGRATPRSSITSSALMVAFSAVDPVAAWRLRKQAAVRADIVPCRASDFREDRTTPNTLAFEASTRGQLLYER
jgi:hypothetical protein